LSIVKGIAERYGGSVDVASELGKGSTFSFELPLASVAEERTMAEPTREE
jgi:signal transduction histidine kinase